ncbi:NAD(P)-dependent oxidoreductase [Streptomyces sp. VMFN-G11Ma]|jgi:phosphoglycerate dehydrogenase-like enzyme|uniref:NAD(P)-dependent oxidoreductase n=1 Tax=Streptomyces sp. VMFN-G11Ma TaxID=2135609 RepID=UPI000D33CE30|nr:NAD(P)-dependent oxidoreductase [Streptomyces sp. VMFN-G11Ma]PTM99730.1 D-3-phosphoglycerate dehydrogenase [Streptomyces sp. VMFN-G11Ma]
MSEHVVVALGPVDADTVAPVLGAGVTFVTDPTPDDLAVAEGAIVRADRHVDEDFLTRQAPRLRVIARTGVGVDLVDVAAASARGVPVVITPGAGSRAVAEGVFAMALHLTKRLKPLTELVREGRWAERSTLPMGDLDGATLGIVGYGRIGRRVGEVAAAFGMWTLAHDPFSPPPPEIACADLGELAESSDVLTLHAPLTDGTRHLVNEELLARVKPGAILINCGRGGLLDQDATLAALEAGRLAGVGLDVFDPEPAYYHPLFDHPDVVLTPHLMGMTRRATTLTFVDAARGVADVLAGRPPAAVADPDWNHRKATA